MKKIILFLILCGVCSLFGCSTSSDNTTTSDEFFDQGYSSGYDEGYDSGYDDGYNEGYSAGYGDGYYEGYDENIYEDLHDFYALIYNLMYDREYEAVAQLMEYYPAGVESALEFEFGTTDFLAVTNYLETSVGDCDICGEPVCVADECYFLPDGIKCAHGECVNIDNGNG